MSTLLSQNNAITHPFSENDILVIGPEWPGKLATLARSFKSQILITLKEEPETYTVS